MKLPIRSQIKAEKGYTLIQCDLSAAEAWVVAYLAHDENMKLGLKTNQFHEITARVIFDYPSDFPIGKDSNQRYLGKRNNHANNYGQGPGQLVKTINSDSDKAPYITITLHQGKLYHSRWHEFYKIKDWWEQIKTQLQKDRTLTTVYRRRRTFYNFWGEELWKEAYAFEPQSTIADHMFGAIQPEVRISGGLREVYKKLVKPSNGDIKLINTSHDSGILEVKNELVDSVSEEFSNYLFRPMIIEGERVDVPVDCEVGIRWGELEKKKVTLIKKEIS